MRIFEDPHEFQRFNLERRCSGAELGLFATLGAVHRGHLSLVERARAENSVVISTVFVNPLMFTTREEADSYPVDWPGDLEKLRAAGVDAVLRPSYEAMYPDGFDTRVTVPSFEQRFESARLPNMVSGISTICSKLFELCVPHRWYFGEKDAQQLSLVTRLAKDLNWPCEIVPCESIREPDGLPFSSRNALMTATERESAICVVDAVRQTKQLYDMGEVSAARLTETAGARIASEPETTLEYAAIVDRDTFAERATADDDCLIIVAAQVGRVRVLDNHPLGRPLPVEIQHPTSSLRR